MATRMALRAAGRRTFSMAATKPRKGGAAAEVAHHGPTEANPNAVSMLLDNWVGLEAGGKNPLAVRDGFTKLTPGEVVVPVAMKSQILMVKAGAGVVLGGLMCATERHLDNKEERMHHGRTAVRDGREGTWVRPTAATLAAGTVNDVDSFKKR